MSNPIIEVARRSMGITEKVVPIDPPVIPIVDMNDAKPNKPNKPISLTPVISCKIESVHDYEGELTYYVVDVENQVYRPFDTLAKANVFMNHYLGFSNHVNSTIVLQVCGYYIYREESEQFPDGVRFSLYDSTVCCGYFTSELLAAEQARKLYAIYS
jgi:hypothetical protein